MVLERGGGGTQGEGIGMSTVQKGAILEKCLNTFASHHRISSLFCTMGNSVIIQRCPRKTQGNKGLAELSNAGVFSQGAANKYLQFSTMVKSET